jgi:hypothetical protein
MLTRDDLLAALGRIHVTAPVRADEVTGSTNATAIEMASGRRVDARIRCAPTDGRVGWSAVERRGRPGSAVLRGASSRLPPARAVCCVFRRRLHGEAIRARRPVVHGGRTTCCCRRQIGGICSVGG